MTTPARVVEIAMMAIRECMGPLVGSPERLADKAHVARMEASRMAAAEIHARAALSALAREGLALVAKEPSEEMMWHFFKAVHENPPTKSPEVVPAEEGIKAMLEVGNLLPPQEREERT